jgi:hypothetical protein
MFDATLNEHHGRLDRLQIAASVGDGAGRVVRLQRDDGNRVGARVAVV